MSCLCLFTFPLVDKTRSCQAPTAQCLLRPLNPRRRSRLPVPTELISHPAAVCIVPIETRQLRCTNLWEIPAAFTSKLRAGNGSASQQASSSGVQRGCWTEPIRPKPSYPAPSTVFPDDSISVRGIETPPSNQARANVDSGSVKRPQIGSRKPFAPQPGASSRQVQQAPPQMGEPFFGVMWPTWYQLNEPLSTGGSMPSAPNSSASSRWAPRATPQTEEPFFGLMWPSPYWYQSDESLSNGSNKPSTPAPGLSNRQTPLAPLDPIEDDLGMNGFDCYLPKEPLPPVNAKPRPLAHRSTQSSSLTRQDKSQGVPSSSRSIAPGTNKRVVPPRSAAPTATNSKAQTSIFRSNAPVTARNTTASSATKKASHQPHKVLKSESTTNAASASQAEASTGLSRQNLGHWH